MIEARIIEQIKQRLIKLYEPQKIYLFGSYAWGQPTKYSDIDLLIVTDKFKEEAGHKKSRYAYEVLDDLNIAKDVLVETSERFFERSKEKPSLEYKIKKDGVLLYESV